LSAATLYSPVEFRLEVQAEALCRQEAAVFPGVAEAGRDLDFQGPVHQAGPDLAVDPGVAEVLPGEEEA
jgi:hypothetical protein